MIGSVVMLLLQSPDSLYAGGASSKTAGTTAIGGHLFRFLFTTVPQWVQLAGIFIGVPVALIVAWQMWKRRRALWAWWVSRSLVVKGALASTALVVFVAGLGSALYGYNYVMHENDFCQSCHIMDTAWNRFQVSAHKNIQCHACHRQPMYVSSVELFWWVTERRMTVPAHDKVPTAVCSECHMRTGTDSTRTLVTLTAGHAVHLRSDSAALKKIECTSCHGRDFHVFKPSNASCTQSGCHTKQTVNLGTMSSRGFPHCTACHDFRSRVKPGVTVTQARLGLVPNAKNCLKCHTMTDQIRNFELDLDPHKGNCGMCHDAHKQTAPKDAYKTCATAGCHANADTLTAFHRGMGKHAIDQCGACHRAHSWRVKGTDCISCHKTINRDRPKATPASVRTEPSPIRRPAGRRHAPRSTFHLTSFTTPAIVARPRPALGLVTPAMDRKFQHSRHTKVACAQCHATNSEHGGLTFTRPAGCNTCHHSARQKARCSACHEPSSLSDRPMPMTFAISARRDPVTRTVPFAHAPHGTVECARCHANGGSRAFTSTCASCHTTHREASADCASCHPTAREGHDRASHAGCAACHTNASVAALPASRPVCLSCHQAQRTHYPAGDCATCHALDGHGMMGAGRVAATQ